MTSNNDNHDKGKDTQDQFKAKVMRGGRDKKYLYFYIPPQFHENLRAGEYVTVVKTEERPSCKTKRGEKYLSLRNKTQTLELP